MKYFSLNTSRFARSLIGRRNGRFKSDSPQSQLRTSANRGNVLLTVLICVVCSTVTIGGVYALIVYETTPGEVGVTPAKWPSISTIPPNEELPTLIVFAHPHCPCTRATISELEQLIARCKDEAAVHVVFFTFDGAPDGWERSDIWESAERIPGVTVWSDRQGLLAKQFGAATSGHAVLYGQNKQLAFSGGITGSRGHAGDNVGRSAIEAILIDGESNRSESLVYGCPIHDQCCKRPE